MNTMPLARYLSLVAWLKWTLTRRWAQRNPGGAIVALLATLGIAAGTLAAFGMLGLYFQAMGEAHRDIALRWTLWIGTLLWLFAPLSQADAQRNIDLSGLRLLPLSRARFALAVLFDGAFSPLGALTLVAAVGCCLAFADGAGELLQLIPAMLLLGLFQLGCAQALFLFGNRVFTSRRFAEISMVAGFVLFMLIQAVNLLLQSGIDSLPDWLSTGLLTVRALFAPLGGALAPGQAQQAFSAAAQGWTVTALQHYGILALQAGGALLLAAWASRLFYEGELESGGQAAAARASVATPRRALFAGHWHGFSFTPLLQALLERERSYLWRDPLVKMQLIQSIFGSLYVAAIALMLNIQQSSDLSNPWLERGARYILLGIALMLGLSESAILFNKFGYEGGQLANLLVTPASRRALLASKSIHLVGHFLPLNLALALFAGIALHAPPLFIVLALLLVTASTLLLDVVGHYVSIYYPFSYRRAGRRMRAVMPQPGCGYVVVYMLVFQACHLLTLPLAAASIALSLTLGWPGLALATLLSAGAVWLAYRFALDDAARRLEEREPVLLGMLAKAE